MFAYLVPLTHLAFARADPMPKPAPVYSAMHAADGAARLPFMARGATTTLIIQTPLPARLLYESFPDPVGEESCTGF